MCHSWWSSYDNHNMFIVQATSLILFLAVSLKVQTVAVMVIFKAFLQQTLPMSMLLEWTLKCLANHREAIRDIPLASMAEASKPSSQVWFCVMNIYSTGITHDHHHMTIMICLKYRPQGWSCTDTSTDTVIVMVIFKAFLQPTLPMSMLLEGTLKCLVNHREAIRVIPLASMAEASKSSSEVWFCVMSF
jgi:hypothetical protein